MFSLSNTLYRIYVYRLLFFLYCDNHNLINKINIYVFIKYKNLYYLYDIK